MNRSWKFAPLAASVLLSSCVYFNTFYNARKQFDDADRKRREVEARPERSRRPQEYKPLYQNAIRKASIVLDRHPNSKWVDDCLLLIGKAFYWREVYDEAALKFQELAENFPESGLIDEARYWRGLSLRAASRIDAAREIFSEIGNTEGGAFVHESRIALAELESDQENFQAALDAYNRLLSDYEKEKKLRAQIWSGIGNASFRLMRYDDALEAYRNVLESGPTIGMNYLTRLQIGKMLELRGESDEALKAYGEILKVKRLRVYEGEIRLKQANVYVSVGDLAAAEEIHRKIIDDFPRSEHSSAAYYEMGLIELQQRKNLSLAKEHFQNSRKEKSNSEAAGLVRIREKLLSDLKRYEKASRKKGLKGLEASFNLAELYVFNLSEPDSAVAIYKRVLENADTTHFAPKALYALGLVYADTLEDSTSAGRYFDQLIEQYPASHFALAARKQIRRERTSEVEARERFHQAEALKGDGAAMEEVLTLYEKIAADYSNTLYAAKAIYALAWCYENERDMPELAREQYQRLIDRYPLSEFSEVAIEKLEGDFLKVEAPPADSARAPDPADRRSESTRRDSAKVDSIAATSPDQEVLPDSTGKRTSASKRQQPSQKSAR